MSKATVGQPSPGDVKPHRQHLVSRSLLRRWTDTSGRLMAYDLEGSRVQGQVKSPNAVCYQHDFIQVDARKAEERWNREVEGDLPQLLASVENGTALDTGARIAALKRLLALHWARSRTVREVNERIREPAAEVVRRRLVLENLDSFYAAFVARYRMLPAGLGALLHLARVELPVRQAEVEAYFAEEVHRHYDRAIALLVSCTRSSC
jgi:hypothetical protein